MAAQDRIDEPSPVLARHRRFRALPWLVVGGGLLALLGLWGWYASRPALVWYLSPPLDGPGVRVRVLVPRGWSPMLAYDPGAVTLQPLEPAFSLPRWLRWLSSPSEGGAYLQIRSTAPKSEEIPFLTDPEEVGDMGFQRWTCRRSIATRDGRRWVEIFYLRANERAFNATHSAICNSLRIE